ncbi:MAG: glycosyltransferase family 1 protein [Patescibacteria group bacterium]
MNQKVFVYDPTLKDKQSSVRGIGRYLQILKENFGNSWIFTDNIKRISADSVFINPFFNFLQTPLTLRKIAQKQIAVIHDLIPLKYPSHFPSGFKGSIYILLNKLALKNYDLIITDSEASKKDIIDMLQVISSKIKVIYPCLPKIFLEIRQQKMGVETGIALPNLPSNFCLYVGDATWNKNLVNLAKAIKLTNVNCVFVGKVFESFSGKAQMPVLSNRQGPLGGVAAKNMVSSFSNLWQKELKKFYELVKDDKRFIFAGFTPDSQLFKLYQQAVLNILPSRDEGFGFSYLEAANFSCPSLLSDIPVLKEISGGNALFCNPNNPQDIADKIKEINSDKNLGNKIGIVAKKRSEYFSSEKFKQEILSVI